MSGRALPRLSDRDLRRYARHLTLSGFGADAQRRLRGSRVLVIGAGGLGSPALLYLAAAGVGHITIIDDDVVDESNLQRQVIHRESDIGRPKAESGADAVRRLDSEVSVDAIVGRLSVDNALELFAAHDVVLDGADNFATRYLSSDAAEITGTPLVWATILQFEGQLSVFWPGRGPMLRDLYPDIPDPGSVPSCAAGGVLGAMVGQVGSMMVVEALKILTGVGEVAVGKLVLIDSLGCSSRSLAFGADPDREPTRDLTEIAQVCAASWDEDAGTGAGASAGAVSGAGVNESPRLTDSVGPNRANELIRGGAVLIDVRESAERAEASIPGSVHVPLGEIRALGWDAVGAALARARRQTGSSGDSPGEIIVHCRSGARSAAAIEVLASERGKAASDSVGSSEVRLINLDGGIVAWQAAGLGLR
ncbi:ThiF family adenylyltransferase [Corynebacterium lactis]|uniref:Molybdenum cofactor biosynthesis protein n=1 Tax=Corynebacterium lactis RW2-5 TaxID=1408189 RepID=A0A0K2H255_9CORY|nr:ThiF family adenylyltransferase [Corynebacterium lactis]ALA68028.1 molybdenum cofactor biosynthesis protein [Corynebacterium lactis RW2-5]